MPTLNSGDTFPTLTVDAVGAGFITLPDAVSGTFGVVLIYRGAWCPYCNAQLAAFARRASDFDELGIKVVAFSVDDEETTAALAEKLRLPFPMGHSVDADKISAITGAFTNDDPRYVQSTGFLLAPDGTVINAVYSTGPIGRLVAEDVAGLVRYVKSQS
jgi:peroxiredoxin